MSMKRDRVPVPPSQPATILREPASGEPMRLRILFVERDPATTDLLVPSLERKGHHVSLASTMAQVRRNSSHSRPQLLVIDVASFGRRGYEVNEAVRTHLEDIPVILLLPEGHDAAGDSAEGYMTPPFTSRKLLHRVRVAADNVAAREIRAGPLILDPDARTLQKGEQTWQLRPKEASLLEMLMCNRGRVVSRKEIMQRVWDTEYTGDTRTISVHVCWLRRKIEPDPGSPRLLKTVRGRGYLFSAPAG
jgi:DNA-binding response OmpR family regulator